MLYTLPSRLSFDLRFQLKLLLVLMICTSSLIQTFCGHLVLDYVVEPHTAGLQFESASYLRFSLPLAYNAVFGFGFFRCINCRAKTAPLRNNKCHLGIFLLFTSLVSIRKCGLLTFE